MTNKCIFLSAVPGECELFYMGYKTISVINMQPVTELPIKCYIYQSKIYDRGISQLLEYGKGKVIGECLCYKVEDVDVRVDTDSYNFNTCMTHEELLDTIKYIDAYYWYFKDFKFYETPLPIDNFYKYNTNKKLSAPPTKWCYVNDVNMNE